MRGLVCSGGGAQAAYQVGALLALDEYGIKFDGSVGASMGAVNSSLYAMDNLPRLYQLWRNASCKQILGIEDEHVQTLLKGKIDKETLKYFSNYIKNKRSSIWGIGKVLDENLDEKYIRNKKYDLGITTIDVLALKYKEIFIDKMIPGKLNEYILASAFVFPVFKFEKIIDGRYYFDGGCANHEPISTLVDRNYDEIYSIKCNHKYYCKKYNPDGKKIVRIIASKDLGSEFFFDKNLIKDNIALGYLDAVRTLSETNHQKLDKYPDYIDDIKKELQLIK